MKINDDFLQQPQPKQPTQNKWFIKEYSSEIIILANKYTTSARPNTFSSAENFLLYKVTF